MLETLIAAVMLASLIVYALMGGADYGGGMWDLLASGPRAQRQRHAIVEAGCHSPERRCSRVDLKALAAGPRSRCGRPAAFTDLSVSDLQRSRRALTLNWLEWASH
jgi:hypothetical protein